MSNSILPSEEQEYKTTYDNRLLSIKRALAVKNETHKMLYQLIEDKPFQKMCLGDFYFDKFIDNINETKPKAKVLLEQYLKDNRVKGDDLENFRFYEKQFEDKLKELNGESVVKTPKKRDITKTYKFKVGVVFATKNIEQYMSSSGTIEHPYSAPQIAKLLGIPKGRPYISATFADYSKTSKGKNIFKDRKYMLAIHKHCDDNDFPMTPFFLKKYEEFKTVLT